MLDKKKWIQIRNSNLKYYEEVELYYKSPSGNIVIYKPEGMKFDLYIQPKDKIKCLRAAQKGFSEGLVSNIVKHDTGKVKNELVNLVDETLSQPRSGGLETAPGLIDNIVSGYSSQPDVVKNLARISFTDYTTTIHSINVMALTIGYCFYNHMTEKETREFGLAALLHDVGKTEVSGEILTASRGLTDLEFMQMKKHPTIGFDILRYTGIDLKVATEGALEHHEKLDGSGYPEGKTKISDCGMLLGIIDCYEAITNDDRPYRSAMQPMAALQILKKDVDKGKYNKKIFETFAYSLTDFDRSGKYKDFF